MEAEWTQRERTSFLAINYLDPRVRGIVRLPTLIDLDEAFYTHYLFLDS